jgi:hypothetical protein
LEKENLSALISILQKEIGLELSNTISYEELLHLTAQRVSYLLENDKDLLLSFLYRLDISMKKINNMLKVQNVVPAHESLAYLIVQRQIERLKTKQSIKVEKLDDEWSW